MSASSKGSHPFDKKYDNNHSPAPSGSTDSGLGHNENQGPSSNGPAALGDKEVVFEQIELDSEDSADDEYQPPSSGAGRRESDDDEDEMRLDFNAADRAELQFEVNILQSSDEDEDEDEDRGESEGIDYQAEHSRDQDEESAVAPTVQELQSDPARQRLIEQQIENERQAYVEFLNALFAKDKSGEWSSENKDSSERGEPAHLGILLPDDDPTNDPNFDYLTAAACFPEDNEEYRDDPAVRVSRREIADLISGHHPPPRPTRVARKDFNARPIQPKTSTANIRAETASLTTPQRFDQPLSNVQLAPAMRDTLRMQMATHAQLLLHLHVHAPSCSPAALNSAAMLHELAHMRDVTMAYKRTFAPFSSFPNPGDPALPASVQSFFNTPVLGAAPAVLAATANGTRPTLSAILTSCGISADVTFANTRLTTSPKKLRQENCWSESEDALLAYILKTRGVQTSEQHIFGESKWALLPHRTASQCEARVKELSSRRMRDNVVKQVVLNSAAGEGLTKDEWKRVKNVVERIGEGDWERVAREACISKRAKVLENEWRYRKRKRLAKQKERMRAKLRRDASKLNSVSTPQGGK